MARHCNQHPHCTNILSLFRMSSAYYLEVITPSRTLLNTVKSSSGEKIRKEKQMGKKRKKERKPEA